MPTVTMTEKTCPTCNGRKRKLNGFGILMAVGTLGASMGANLAAHASDSGDAALDMTITCKTCRGEGVVQKVASVTY